MLLELDAAIVLSDTRPKKILFYRFVHSFLRSPLQLCHCRVSLNFLLLGVWALGNLFFSLLLLLLVLVLSYNGNPVRTKSSRGWMQVTTARL
jgi:hypothetical protein